MRQTLADYIADLDTERIRKKRKVSMFWNWLKWQCDDEDEFLFQMLKLLRRNK